MGEFASEWGIVDLPKYPLLSEQHLENCVVLPNRLVLLDKMPQRSIVVEVGVKKGTFSAQLLKRCQPSQLHLIDRNLKNHKIKKKFETDISNGVVHLHQGDSSTVLDSFPDEYFDFIYIDADHSYNGVTRDITVAKHKVKDGGYLVFNDYTYWSPIECMRYGVQQAVNELCINEGWEVIYFALAHFMYCDVVIRRISAKRRNDNFEG